MKFLSAVLLATAALSSALPATSRAQPAAFPSKTVTLVVPFTANSGSDIIARIVGPKLAARWGQAVLVDNRPGASGNLGANLVAKAVPDGHTLLMMISTFTMAPAIYKSMPFDPVADFTPIAKLADASFTFAVNPSVPVKDVPSLIDFAKKNPGKTNYASPGNGTPQHLAMELLKARAGLDIVHVPYKGIAGALTELMGGQVQMMFASIPSMLQFAQSGRVRLLGVTGAARSPLAPTIPTFREQGIDYMDSVDAWYGVMAPAHAAPELVARLNRDFLAVMNQDDVKAELAKQGLTIRTGSPDQLGALVKSDLARWSKVVKDAGITAE